MYASACVCVGHIFAKVHLKTAFEWGTAITFHDDFFIAFINGLQSSLKIYFHFEKQFQKGFILTCHSRFNAKVNSECILYVQREEQHEGVTEN